MHRFFAMAVSSVLACVLLQVPAYAESASSEPAPLTSAEADALQEARKTGQAAEVSGQTTETSKLSVAPDGQLLMELSPAPVRVKRDGVFHDVDLTLQRRPDDRIAPRVTNGGVAFGGGGDDVLATMVKGDKSLTLTWPGGELPEPVLEGSYATYVDAGGPGVDVVVKATLTGWSHYLVVKTPEAAQNPDLAKVEFGVRTSGVDLKERSDSSLEAVDTLGTEVFSAPRPVMWEGTKAQTEASSAPTVPEEVVAGPAPRSEVKPMGVEVGSGELSLVPDRELLTAADTKFPVVIDPSWQVWNAGREPDSDGGNYGAGWAYVDMTFPDRSYWASDRLPTGREDEDGTYKRSYIRMNTTTLHDVSQGRKIKINDVTITFDVQHAWSCTARDVRLYNVTHFNSSTTWNNRPDWYIPDGSGWATAWLSDASVKVGRPECGDSGTADDVKFDGGNLIRLMQYYTDKKWDYFNLGIFPDAGYNDTDTWKVLDEDPRMVVKFSRYPDAPTDVKLFNGGTTPYECVQGSGRPWVGSSEDRRLTASIKDLDADNVGWSGQPLRAEYELAPLGKPDESVLKYSPANGSYAQAGADGVYQASLTAVNGDSAPAGPDGGTTWSWRVRGQDDTALSGPWSGWCEYTVDGVRPNAPAVSAALYPERKWSGYDSAARAYSEGSFTFGPNASGDVVKYTYTFSDGTAGTKEVTAGGSATFPWTPKKFGWQWVEVTSHDRAGNHSEKKKYEFGVEQPPRDAAWSMDEASGTVAKAVAGSGAARPGANLLFVGGPTRDQPGNRGDAVLADRSVKFNGSSQYGEVQPVLDTGSAGEKVPLVDTGKRFMFSTWVKPDSIVGDRIAISQSATDGSVFELGWIGGRWTFRHRKADGTVLAKVIRDRAKAPDGNPWTNFWVSLMAGYDPISKEIWLRTQAEGQVEVCQDPDDPFNCEFQWVMPEETTPTPDPWTGTAGTGPLVFGATTAGTGKGSYWDGRIDDTQVWPLAHPDGTVLRAIYGESVQDQQFAGSTLRLVNVNSGHCLDVAGAGTGSGTNVIQWTCNAGAAQNWEFTDVGGDYYTLTNPKSGKCLDVEAPGTADGDNVWQYDCNGGDDQRWKPEKRPGGYWLKSKSSNKCLAVSSAIRNTGGDVLQWTCQDSHDEQVWNITTQKRHEFDGITYRLSGKGSGKCLDVRGGATANGADAFQWACNSETWQDWIFTGQGDGFYSLTNVNSGRCLEVTGAATNSEANVAQGDCKHGDAHQAWKVVPVQADGNLGYRLIAKHSGLLLTVKDASTTDGGDAVQSNPKEPTEDHQVWKLGCFPTDEHTWRCAG